MLADVRKRLGGTRFAWVVLLGLAGAAVPEAARSFHWEAGLPPLGGNNVLICSDGFFCARQQQIAFYGTGIVFGDCGYSYTQDGRLVGAGCEGHTLGACPGRAGSGLFHE